MNKTVGKQIHSLHQNGMTLVEMMVSITISLIVLSGVVQALVVSKSNFISQRELAGLQENARFAIKYMTDEIRLAGFTGCIQAGSIADLIKGSTTNSTGSWYLDYPGLQGYEYDAGVATFPAEFRADVRANTDALAVRRGAPTGLRVVSEVSPTITVQVAHSYQPGQPMLVINPDCEQIGIFQMSGPANGANTATTIIHNTGTALPGNGGAGMKGAFTYSAAGSISPAAYVPATTPYNVTSTLLALHSEAYFIGNSDSDSTVPALVRDRMFVNTATNTPSTVEEELVQGVENMQILYGMDNITSSTGLAPPDGLADAYVKANAVVAAGGWTNVVAVRITLRMRSINPVYTTNVDYPVFEGVTGTNGSDRYMRQTISSTIMIRNYKI